MQTGIVAVTDGKDEGLSPVAQLRQAANCIRAFLDDYDGDDKGTVAFGILDALARLTHERLDAGDDLDEIQFTPDEIIAQIYKSPDYAKVGRPPQRKHHDSSNYNEKCARWVRRHWDNVERILQEFESKLIRSAAERGLSVYPGVGKDKTREIGGQGRQSRYCINSIPLPKDQPQTTDTASNELAAMAIANGGLRYEAERVSRVPIWARCLDEGFSLVGWRKWLVFWALMIPLLLLTCGWFFISLILPIGGFEAAASFGFLLLAITCLGWEIFGPFYQVHTWRVAMAPFWCAWTIKNPVLERRPAQNADNDIMRMVVYSGRCPACKGRIDIEKGRWFYPGRLVGRCRNSPREHVFSFDHITMTGYPLRGSYSGIERSK